MSQLLTLLKADWARLNALACDALHPLRARDILSPRFAPVVLVRLAQTLHAANWKRLAKLPALANFVLFGIEVPPRMPIGPGLVLMHTQGTVLGAASIGTNVTLYHQVTLGARELDFPYTPHLRPVIEDGVVVGAGAKVLGGLTLGANSVVGANAVVIHNIPPHHVAVGVPAKAIPQRGASTRDCQARPDVP